MAKKTTRKGTGPKRSKEQREADFTRLRDMYVRGWTQVRIGQELGISHAAVSNDLKELHRRWREETTLALDDYKRKELAKLDELEREYWQAWERSQSAQETKRQRKKTGDDGAESLQEMVSRAQCGDAQYLAGIIKCIEKRCKLLGLDAPVKTEGVWYGKMSISEAVAAAAKPEGEEA
jgi:predicted transcriptional regulator